jgi:SAM-dependent methyltransferase
VVAVVSDRRRAKRLFAEAYDASAAGFARSADRLVYTYLARPLARVLGEAAGPVLDVAAGSGALGRLLPAAVALDLSAAQLRHNPLPARLQGDAERLPFRDDAFTAAGCAFGINHFPDPRTAVAEMARVAPVVGLLTWVRPEAPYRPKQAVLEVVARHAGSDRTAAGILADELGERVGSPAAVLALLEGAGLGANVAEVEPGLVGRLGQHPDAVPAQVLDGGVAVVGVHPQREPAVVHGRPGLVGAGADAQVGPAQVQGHVPGLTVGRELVADPEAEQVPVEAERPAHVPGGQDREHLLEHRPSEVLVRTRRPRWRTSPPTASRCRTAPAPRAAGRRRRGRGGRYGRRRPR